MSDKNNVRGDIYNAIAKTYKPKVPVPEGGRRDTLEYRAPRAKFSNAPYVTQTAGSITSPAGYKRGRKVII